MSYREQVGLDWAMCKWEGGEKIEAPKITKPDWRKYGAFYLDILPQEEREEWDEAQTSLIRRTQPNIGEANANLSKHLDEMNKLFNDYLKAGVDRKGKSEIREAFLAGKQGPVIIKNGTYSDQNLKSREEFDAEMASIFKQCRRLKRGASVDLDFKLMSLGFKPSAITEADYDVVLTISRNFLVEVVAEEKQQERIRKCTAPANHKCGASLSRGKMCHGCKYDELG